MFEGGEYVEPREDYAKTFLLNVGKAVIQKAE